MKTTPSTSSASHDSVLQSVVALLDTLKQLQEHNLQLQPQLDEKNGFINEQSGVIDKKI